MPLLQSFQLEHLPPSYTVHVALYEHVRNAAFLQQQLLDGNTAFEYAFIDGSLILSPTHILAAAYRAITDLLAGRLKSRNVHSEVVFSLSMNNNIAESFRRFGISESSTCILILKISTPSTPITAEAVQSHLSATVEGDQVVFSEEKLQQGLDEKRVRKIYKMGGVGKGESDERRELEVGILGAMALRGAVN